MTRFLIFIFSTLCLISFGQVDVQSYKISLSVSDDHDTIHVRTQIGVIFSGTADSIVFDLTSKNDSGTGMHVLQVEDENKLVKYRHNNDRLTIFNDSENSALEHNYSIVTKGVPRDGLVIGTNKHGNRTIFGDNWPNRAHNWFPCVDHPSDKALVYYEVIAPEKYTVVANGRFKGRMPLSDGEVITYYRASKPLPTKVMVVGIAELVSDTLFNKHGFEHINWVYPQDEKNGFHDMHVASDPLNFYIEMIAPYPFDKLYNVQSTTRFGGMENAGCIFYDEKAIKGKGTMENLIAHEIAHQWFGNSASEMDWPHLWLSEGFATYFTSLHLEHKYGREAMNAQLKKDRKRIIKFAHKHQTPVIDTITESLMYRLNANSYQKGSWFLHMLRNKIGTDKFWNGIRAYYDRYKYSNATSENFQAIMEKETGLHLSSFFDQWLRQSGHPLLSFDYNKRKFCIKQHQIADFDFPITIEFVLKNGDRKRETFNVTDKFQSFDLNYTGQIDSFEVDPEINLLFEIVE